MRANDTYSGIQFHAFTFSVTRFSFQQNHGAVIITAEYLDHVICLITCELLFDPAIWITTTSQSYSAVSATPSHDDHNTIATNYISTNSRSDLGGGGNPNCPLLLAYQNTALLLERFSHLKELSIH
eukprot:scaffold51304_cov59-Attheya_sp.AAC.2